MVLFSNSASTQHIFQLTLSSNDMFFFLPAYYLQVMNHFKKPSDLTEQSRNLELMTWWINGINMAKWQRPMASDVIISISIRQFGFVWWCWAVDGRDVCMGPPSPLKNTFHYRNVWKSIKNWPAKARIGNSRASRREYMYIESK